MRQLTSTTVVTPPSTTDLSTLADVKLQLNINDTTNDAWLTSAISRGSIAIQTYCNRIFAQQTLIDQIWLQNDNYPYQVPGQVAPLQLSTWPVISVASVIVTEGVNVTQNLSQGTDYFIDNDMGQLIRINVYTSFPTNWDSAPTTVNYVAGYATIPLDIEEALLRWIAGAYQARSRDPNLKERDQPGLGREVFWVPNAAPAYHFPPEIAELLDKYRTPSVR